MGERLGAMEAMAGLPVGTVTLLFTDIEGSTQRWDRDRTAMQAAVRRHDEIMRTVIANRNGRVFKTIGDAFCAVFWHPEDGVAAALDIQRALQAEDFSSIDGLRVRMALHTGTTDARDGDYFGPTVNRVARILSTGHGGQVILSSIAAELVRPHLEGQASLRDLGEHRLKDLTAPERIFQLVAAGLESDFPKLRSLSVLDNNLPQQLSSFVGRDSDVAEIKALLETSRLVTLFGAGGVGKTRCALQVGAELLDTYNDGVWFVDFAPLTDGSLVASEIASVFSVHESGAEPLLDAIVTYLRNKKLLLIFDNCEHVIVEASKAAGALLRSCSGVAIVATSREGLGIPGEAVYRMPSLTVPESTAGLRAADALAYGSIALFDARSRAANPRFELTDDNAPIVADVCKRLDGIPLAIELAAARVKVLAPRQLAQKLDERFRILTGGDRTALPRQQTMRALIDWSYDLLTETERTVFRRLSVFSGSFTLESAGAICSDETLEEFDVLDLTSSLVDKSLLNTEHVGDDVRYRLLESTRQYARDKATENGEFEDLARKHALSFLDAAQTLNAQWDATPDNVWLGRAIPDVDNFRAAIAWSLLESNDVAVGQQLAGYLYWLWREYAPGEGRRYIDRAIDAISEATPPLLKAELDLVKSGLEMFEARYRASLSRIEGVLEAFDEREVPMLAGYAHLTAGRSLIYLDRGPEGEARLQEALTLFRTVRGRKCVAAVLENLGVVRASAGDFPAARTFLKEALSTYKLVGAVGRIPNTMSILADVEFRSGDIDAALSIGYEALDAFRAFRFAPTMSSHLGNMAAYLVRAQRYDEARGLATEALTRAMDAQQEVFATDALLHLAAVAALCPIRDDRLRDEERTRAAGLLGYVEARYSTLDVGLEAAEEQEHGAATASLAEHFGEERLAALKAAGHGWSEADAADHARATGATQAVAA